MRFYRSYNDCIENTFQDYIASFADIVKHDELMDEANSTSIPLD